MIFWNDMGIWFNLQTTLKATLKMKMCWRGKQNFKVKGIYCSMYSSFYWIHFLQRICSATMLSACEKILPLFSILKISLMYIINKTGPNTVPCGTHQFLYLKHFPFLPVVFGLVDDHEIILIWGFVFQCLVKMIKAFHDWSCQKWHVLRVL